MNFHDLADVEQRELMPGIVGKLLHTDSMTLGYFNIEKGAILPNHAHPHEQVTNVLSGEFEMTVNGETRLLTTGCVATIPSNAEHSGIALTDCKVVDVFNPVREDYK